MKRRINVQETHGRPGCNRKDAPSGELSIIHSGLHDESNFTDISIRSGIKMIIANYKCRSELQMDYDICNAPVSLCYNLSQRLQCTMNNGSGRKNVVERLPGESVLAYLPKTRGTT